MSRVPRSGARFLLLACLMLLPLPGARAQRLTTWAVGAQAATRALVQSPRGPSAHLSLAFRPASPSRLGFTTRYIVTNAADVTQHDLVFLLVWRPAVR